MKRRSQNNNNHNNNNSHGWIDGLNLNASGLVACERFAVLKIQMALMAALSGRFWLSTTLIAAKMHSVVLTFLPHRRNLSGNLS